jgi:hypothetical protein
MCNSVNLGFVTNDLKKIYDALQANNFGSAKEMVAKLHDATKYYNLEFVEINYNAISRHDTELKNDLTKQYSEQYEAKLESAREKLQQCFDEKVEREVQNRMKTLGGGAKVEVDVEKCQ